MFSSIIWPSFERVLNGDVSFDEVIGIFKEIWQTSVGSENFKALWDKLDPYLAMLGVFVPVCLLALSLVEAFFGRKLLGFQKFVAFFGVGFIAGVSVLHTLISDIGIVLPDWVVGLVCGIVLALLSQFLYIVLYIGISGYSMYMMTMGGQVLPEGITAMTADNMVLSLVIVVVTVVLMLIFRKWVEMAGTALLGGYLTALSAESVILALAGVEAGIVARVIILTVVFVFGLFTQVKTRRKKIKF